MTSSSASSASFSRGRRRWSLLLVEPEAWARESLLRSFPPNVYAVGVETVGQALERLSDRAWSALVVSLRDDADRALALARTVVERGRTVALLCTHAEHAADAAARARQMGAIPMDGPLDRVSASCFDQWLEHREAPFDDAPIGDWALLPTVSRPPLRAQVTPNGLRRARARVLDPLHRVPQVVDTVAVLGSASVSSVCFAQVERAPSESASSEWLGKTRSLAAVVSDPAHLPLLLELRRERPETPICLVGGSKSLADSHGFHHVARPDPSSSVTLFVDQAVLRFAGDRHALDQRALAWGLTNREAELVWLASMVMPRRRVMALFGGSEATFKSHLARALAKLGVRSFHEIGRVARG